MVHSVTKGKGKRKEEVATTPAAAPESPAAPEKPPLEGLTQEEIARMVGCNQSTVSRAIKRGLIATLTNGRVPLSAADALRELWSEEQKFSDETVELERRVLTAETGEKEAKAKLRQLELEREQGKYVELAQVERAGKDAAHRILAVLRAIPQRTARELDAALASPPDRRAAAIEKIMSREVERAIAEMRKSLYLQADDERTNAT